MSTAGVKGTLGFLDPIFTTTGEQSEVTDAYGIGVTILMCLTGLSGLKIVQKCKTMMRNPDRPSKWQPPAVPDATAGEWPEETAVGLAELAVGLAAEQYADDRMTLAEAIEKLEELCAAHPPVVAAAATAPPAAPPPAVRECEICMDAPREVRFACGHSNCCQHCYQTVVLADAEPKCPTCREPAIVAEQGAQVGSAPTWVPPEPAAAPGRGGRGGRGRGRGRGRA